MLFSYNTCFVSTSNCLQEYKIFYSCVLIYVTVLLRLYNFDREGILNAEFVRMRMEVAVVYCNVSTYAFRD
jgi:hypothetical protein